jgi:Uncharacterized protein conserved in bacteria (DUF2184)
MIDPILQALAANAGIHFMGVDAGLQIPEAARNYAIAQDAQPVLVTTSNAGIPSFLTTYIDPAFIDVLVAPMRAAEIAGEEVKKGDWLTETAMFPVVESTGEISSYGDYSADGVAGTNFDFPQRQSYTYQVITQWGERELERAGLARINYANQLNIASALTLNKFQNKSYFFGVSGLQNYGLLNDPNLLAPIAPTSEAGAILWSNPLKDALGVLADVAALFAQLQLQANGLVELDTKMTLAMSPGSEANGLTKTTSFNVNVADLIKKNYPNMTVKTAPEYATASGNLLQLYADSIDGQRTAAVAFTEKMRAHPMKVELSSFKQKKSQGTFGAIIYRPFLIAQMLGV